jgi:hypothetical protein
MKATLNWKDLRALGHTDNGGRWHPNKDIAPYFLRNIRAPSRAWPHSYAKAAQTNKFVNWLFANRPEIAARFNFNGEE